MLQVELNICVQYFFDGMNANHEIIIHQGTAINPKMLGRLYPQNERMCKKRMLKWRQTGFLDKMK